MSAEPAADLPPVQGEVAPGPNGGDLPTWEAVLEKYRELDLRLRKLEEEEGSQP